MIKYDSWASATWMGRPWPAPIRRVLLLLAPAALLMSVAACEAEDDPDGAEANDAEVEEVEGDVDDVEAVDTDDEWGTIDFVVPVEAGGGSDTYARTFMPVIAECLDTNVAVRNVPGDGHLLGIGEVARAEPDGETLTGYNLPAIPITQMARVAADEDPGVDIRENTYIGTWGSSHLVLYSHPDFVDDIDGLMEAYEDDEDVIGAQDRGGGGEVITYVMREQWGLDWDELVPFDGGSDLVAAILREEVLAGVTTDASGQDAVDAGDLEPIASLGPDESPLYPDVPTAEEQGYEDLSAIGFWPRTLAGPPDIPDERLEQLETCLEEAVGSEIVQTWSEDTDNPVTFAGSEETTEAAVDAFDVIDEIEGFEDIVAD